MREQAAAIERLGAGVLVVSFATPERVAEYLKETALPFPMAADPTLAAYHAFGMGRTSIGSLLRPGVLARYLGWMLHGWLPKPPRKGDDVMQLGGDFILDADGRLVFAHPCRLPTDRPPVASLVEVLRGLAPR